ncbi:copper(I)-binding protein [Roseivivax halodurans JCM 10272]|uniref:Copper(I)-binding protein n=1 Tax=Roseivivax halodurans JCM 10272 TaxID=1449350 RepID=X7EDX0_9RHOB|nr:copper chaperone PCu(A)C [Roseivivax halodurans]ETX14070.1 copper(I)-binding protein [Roseivivax halodurans JCM 10272]
MKSILLTAGLLVLATPALADITVTDAYARAASPVAKSGAAFMVLENDGDEDDRIVGVSSDAADQVELHTHAEDANGMMIMSEVEEGFAVPAGGTHVLGRGGDHVMFMGLRETWENGDTIPVTLTFEKAGDVQVEIPVDNDRMPHGH